MAARIRMTLFKISIVVLSIIQLVTCAGGEASDSDNGVAEKPKINVFRPVPPDPMRIMMMIQLVKQLQAKRPAVWQLVQNTFDLSQMSAPEFLTSLWDNVVLDKKKPSAPTGSQAPQKGTDSAQASKPTAPADKKTPEPVKEAGTEQAVVPSNKQEAKLVQAEVPQPSAAVPSNSQEAKPVQPEVPKPIAAVSSNSQEAKPVQPEVPKPIAAVPSNSQQAKPVPQSAQSNPSQVAGSSSPSSATSPKPNTSSSPTVEAENPWARPSPAAKPKPSYEGAKYDYLDFLKVLVYAPEPDVMATLRRLSN